MNKIVVAVYSVDNEISECLRNYGYKIISFREANQPGTHVDAFLYTYYKPSMLHCYSNIYEQADISIGGNEIMECYDPITIMINISGMNPDEVLLTLNHRMRNCKLNQ